MYNKLQKMKKKAEKRGCTVGQRVFTQEQRFHPLTLKLVGGRNETLRSA